MKTADQVEVEFRADLQALLKKWGAEIEAEDHYPGYPECGEDIRMEVHIPGKYESDGTCLQDFAVINLGTLIRADDA